MTGPPRPPLYRGQLLTFSPLGPGKPRAPLDPWGGGEKGVRDGTAAPGGLQHPKRGGHRAEIGGSNSRARPAARPPAAPARPAATRGSAPYRAHGGSVGSPQAPQLLTFSPLAPGGPAMAWGTGERGVRLGGALLHPSDQGKAAGSPALTCPGAPASPGSPLGPAGPEGPGTPWHKAGSPQPVLSPGGLAGGCPTPLPSCRASRALRPSPTRRPDPARLACRSPPADGTAGIWGCEHPIAPQPLGAGFPMG